MVTADYFDVSSASAYAYAHARTSLNHGIDWWMPLRTDVISVVNGCVSVS